MERQFNILRGQERDKLRKLANALEIPLAGGLDTNPTRIHDRPMTNNLLALLFVGRIHARKAIAK